MPCANDLQRSKCSPGNRVSNKKAEYFCKFCYLIKDGLTVEKLDIKTESSGHNFF